MPLDSYRRLEVWKRSMTLVEHVYRLTASFPIGERFGLVSQIRRAAVSVPANIAEGYARTHRGDYLRHLSIAQGSMAEVETLLTLAARLKFVNRDDALKAWKMAQQVARMLKKLIRSLQPQTRHPTP